MLWSPWWKEALFLLCWKNWATSHKIVFNSVEVLIEVAVMIILSQPRKHRFISPITQINGVWWYFFPKSIPLVSLWSPEVRQSPISSVPCLPAWGRCWEILVDALNTEKKVIKVLIKKNCILSSIQTLYRCVCLVLFCCGFCCCCWFCFIVVVVLLVLFSRFPLDFFRAYFSWPHITL